MRLGALLTLGLAAACTRSTVEYDEYPVPRGMGMAAARYMPGVYLDDPSLFATDDEVLSDSAIRRILDHRLTLPPSVRVAVLQLSERSLEWTSWRAPSELLGTSPEPLLAALARSPRVREAGQLPALLVPSQRTVGYLREAAARFQADVLLVYRTDCRSVTRQRFLMTDEVRAVCVAEAVAIDTRTGIVPITVRMAEEFEAKKTREDVNFRETVRRAELAATGDALAAVGRRVGEFLSEAD